MVKRFLSIILIAMVVLTLFVGCSQKGKKDITSSSSDQSDTTTSSDWDEYSTDPTDESSSDIDGETSSDASNTGSGSKTSTSGGGGKATTTSKPATTSTPPKEFKGTVADFTQGAPYQGQLANSLKPTFIWSAYKNAKSFTLYIDELKDGKFVNAYTIKDIKSDRYQMPTALKEDTTYRWRVVATTLDNKTEAVTKGDKNGNVFIAYIDPKKHPVNTGIDFKFNGTISEKVLKNYLARSIILSFLQGDYPSENPIDDERLIINIGAKYIGRAACPWISSPAEESKYPEYKERMARLHAIDPDIIFEACIFEYVDDNINNIEIPDWVFKAFNQPVVKKNFNRLTMTHPENLGGLGEYHVPDMSKLETQMWFYYRACQFIDLGFEGLHMGQIQLISSKDSGYVETHKVFNMIREYAKKNARRGIVLINGHTNGLLVNGVQVNDFNSMVLRPQADPNDTPHLATEDNPQRVVLKAKILDTIYGRSKGGKTYFGWSTNSLPYFVEIDNCGGRKAQVGYPTSQWYPWGFDEVSWFVNQPDWYRHEFIDYAYKWVKEYDPQGAFEMLGSRPAVLITNNDLQRPKSKWIWYQCNSKTFNPNGFGDEEVIRATWLKYKNLVK